MSDGRLPAALEAAAIRRLVESAGGNAMVVRRGDPDSGALLLEIRQRGEFHLFLERALTPDGLYRWRQSGPAVESNSGEIADFVQRRARFDQDLWIIELNVPDAQRFTAELGTIG